MPKSNKNPGVLFGVFMFLLVAGCIAFFAVTEDYFTYTSGTIETAAKLPTPSKEQELTVAAPAPASYNTEVKYRTFFITAPEAKKVELAADFNRWGKDPIELKGYRRGYFETSVALTSGEYKYVFLVDGKDVLDPSNKDRITVDGREVCIKTVR